MHRPLLTVYLAALMAAVAVAGKRDPLLVPKAAAAVKAAIPGAEAQVQGNVAVVKWHTTTAPAPQNGRAARKQPEVPAADGVMFVLQVKPYWPEQVGPGQGVLAAVPPGPQKPTFDRKQMKLPAPLAGKFYPTRGVQVFPDANTVLIADIAFGPRTDTAMLERAYAALTQFATSELK